MKKVFISSPFRGDIEKNTELACELAKQTIQMGHIPILPHLYFPQILDDADPLDRGTGMALGLMLMHECDMMVTYGEPSEGMALEIAYWKTIKNVEPIRWPEFTSHIDKIWEQICLDNSSTLEDKFHSYIIGQNSLYPMDNAIELAQIAKEHFELEGGK